MDIAKEAGYHPRACSVSCVEFKPKVIPVNHPPQVNAYIETITTKKLGPQQVFLLLRRIAPHSKKPMLKSLLKRIDLLSDENLAMTRKFLADIADVETNPYACIAAVLLCADKAAVRSKQAETGLAACLVKHLGWQDARTVTYMIFRMEILGVFLPMCSSSVFDPSVAYFSICASQGVQELPIGMHVSRSQLARGNVKLKECDPSGEFINRDGNAHVRCKRNHPDSLCTPDHWENDWHEHSDLIAEKKRLLARKRELENLLEKFQTH